MSIYQSCEIRGHYCTELTPDLFHRWGRVLGSRLKPAAKFVVGGDVRLSTPELLAELVRGLCEAGLNVVDLGCLPTPMIDYARRRLKADGCAVVTASHSAPDFNGLRWMLGQHPPRPDEIALLRRGAEEPGSVSLRGRKPTEPRTLDTTFDYVAWLQETWVDARTASCHLVLDPLHGCWAGRARRYLHAIFPPMMITAVHDQPDPVFGGRRPDCCDPEILDELAETVDRERADLGIAFDGDGDRVAFVDNEGAILSVEETAWVLLQAFGERLRDKPLVHDVRVSDRLADAARDLGAKPCPQPGVPSVIRAKMLETGAPLGIQTGGHYFFADLGGGDDGLFAACCMIAHLADDGTSLAEWRRRCPPVHMTPDIDLPVAPGHAEKVLRAAAGALKKFPQSTVEGVRIDLPEGWALLRASPTESAVTFRFEATAADRLDKLVRRVCRALPDLGDELWSRYDEVVEA